MKLVDIDSSNGLFTWNNRRGGGSLVASKLDRFIILEDLILNDKGMEARILPFGGFDHWPIQLEIRGIGTPKNRPFRFENIWLTHPNFTSNISSWWSEDLHIQGTSMFLLHKKLKHIKLRLKYWNKKEFGNFFEGKKAVENKLQILNQSLIKDGFDKVSNDRATKLQHESTLANRAHNRISSIKDEGGKLLNTHEEIEAVLVQHFHGIAKETISNIEPYIKDLTRHIPRLVSRENKFNLNRPVTEEEISEVLKEMQNGKAQGPDGINVDFFKACWNIVKQDILNVVEDSKRNRTIRKELNTSFISLIPK
eukprot:PITA_03950